MKMIRLRYLVFILAVSFAHPLLAGEAIQSGAITGANGHFCFITNASNDTIVLDYARFYSLSGDIVLEGISPNCHKNMSLMPGQGCQLTVNPAFGGGAIGTYCRVQYFGKAGGLMGVIQNRSGSTIEKDFGGYAISLVPVDFRAELSGHELAPAPKTTHRELAPL